LEILDPWKATPLFRACSYLASAPCVEALLKAGADVNTRDYTGHQPIHSAALAGQSDKIMSMLIAKGSNIEDSGPQYKQSPLASSAISNRGDTCKFLLAQGANIDSRDYEGDTPFSEAIRSSAHEALTVLLSAGANYLHVNDHGYTALHSIATGGDRTTMAIMSGLDLAGLDSGAKDKSGRTDRDYLQLRGDLSDGLREAFEQLMEQIRIANSQHQEDENDNEDIFHDAFEHLNIGENGLR